MKKLTIREFSALMLILIISMCQLASINAAETKIIPKPVSSTMKKGDFTISSNTGIYVQSMNPAEMEEILKISQYFADKLNSSTGFNINVDVTDNPPAEGIYLSTINGDFAPDSENDQLDAASAKESYQLDVTKSLVTLKAQKPEGLFRGIQTILQLLPADIVKSYPVQEISWTIPCCSITDYPSYPRRGMMLDVARHFFSVDEVKKLIDILAQYKINIFHMHLTDDQGWRIEIKSRPELTNIGGSKQVLECQKVKLVVKNWKLKFPFVPVPPGGKVGYYTQEQFTDIVNYAKDRYITIVPEIDMPGHCNAALMSYPCLVAKGAEKPYWRLNSEVGYSWLTFNEEDYPEATEQTKKFIDDVIKEIAALTPGDYIHIGNDEIPPEAIDASKHSPLYLKHSEFIKFVESTVRKYNKKMIAWNPCIGDVANDIAADNIIQYWKGDKSYPQPMIVSDAWRTYMDERYSFIEPVCLPLYLNNIWILGIKPTKHFDRVLLTTIIKAYIWDLSDYTPKNSKCLGIEGALWTESLPTMDLVEIMTFPRILGYAEIGWTPKDKRNLIDYLWRLKCHYPRMENQNINFYRSPLLEDYLNL